MKALDNRFYVKFMQVFIISILKRSLFKESY